MQVVTLGRLLERVVPAISEGTEAADQYLTRRQAQLIAGLRFASRPDYSPDCVLVFTHCYLYPDQLRKRVKEVLRLSGSIVEKEVSLDLGLDELELPETSQESLFLIPVMRPVKGRILTGLEIVDSHGGRISTLSYEEGLTFTIHAARQLVVDAFGLYEIVTTNGKKELQPIELDKWSDLVGSVFRAIIECMVVIPPKESRSPEELEKFRDRKVDGLEELVRSLGVQVKDEKSYASLKQLVRFSATNYSIIARVPAARHCLLRYTYRAATTTRTARLRKLSWYSSAKGALRSVLGGTPTSVKIAANKAKNCRSFHLALSVPDGSHISGIFLTDAEGRLVHKPRRPTYNLGGAYFRTAGHGLETGHFYSRNLSSGSENRHLVLDFRVGETPSGATGRAFLAAAMVSFLIALVANVPASSEVNGFQIDLAAIVLATVPAAVGTMAFVSHVGSSHDTVRSLLATLSGLVTTATAIGTVSLLVLRASETALIVPKWLDRFTVIGLPHGLWSALFLLSAVNSVVTGGAVMVRRIRHQKLLAKNANLDNEGVVVNA